MSDVSVVGFFCDDVRQEKSNTVTLVGVYPDNISVQEIPFVFARLCAYVRSHLGPDFKPARIVTTLLSASGEELNKNEAAEEVVAEVLRKVRAEGKPYGGLIATLTMVPMPATQPGRLRVLVSIADKEYTATALNVMVASKAT